MTHTFANFACWKPNRIGAVINKEALSVDRADFLATHVPMRQIAYERSPRAVTSASEADLLAELHHEADAGHHTFVVIKGVPGTGKSHLIRWLKERYAAERPRDAVLLIERANTSLRGTLQQIIHSGLFDRAGLPDSLQRLHEAVTELTADALADNLLDQIKTAILELEAPELPNRLKPDKVYRFLLDVVIREHLKLPDGPIERIAAFLSHGRSDNSGADEAPGFEPDDFVFQPDLLRKLHGYPEAKKVAEDLQYKAELRETLARYLNHLLRRYAISRATRLSAQDLREMFNELRRHLRGLGIELALFIEDITAFTGIDEGLLDVLITQHTGEGNTAYCRMTSVIGVTDAYFSDYMPDNFKQRVTHQLTLSSNTALGGSDLMQDEAVRVEFAARYMNAIRSERDKLEQWVRAGASAAALPIACESCPFQETCFDAFGFVEIADKGEAMRIGLYPFNRQSLSTLYRGLRDSYPRTPRTYLFDVLGYILQSHGARIESGDFPPPEGELAPAVQIPSFNPPTHRQIVEKQGGAAASRLMTLLLYWGDRSANRIGGNLGSLSESVYRAFSIKAIEGAVAETVASNPVAAPENAPVSPHVTPTETDRYTRLIDAWMTTGRLSGYDRFAEWMADLVRSFIDWQAHGISLEQVKEYITQGRFEIEGQTGVSQRKHRLFFARTPELRYVLQALADLNSGGSLSQAQYGEHLATLSTWLRSEEERIVAFVREPSGLMPSADYLSQILIRNVVLLACLSGELKPTDDPLNLYHQVVESCTDKNKWEDRVAAAKDVYPQQWRSLMREVNNQNNVSICRRSLLQLLNRPQGRSDAVRYVDAAHLLRVLGDFAAADWELPELTFVPDTTDPTWGAAIAVYNALRKSFATAVATSYDELENLHAEMTSALAGTTPTQMLHSMRDALRGLRTVGIAYSARLDEPFSKDTGSTRWTPESFDLVLAQTGSALQIGTLQGRALYAGANWGTDITFLRDRVLMLRLFEQEMSKKAELLTRKIDELKQKTEAAQGYQRAIEQFDRVIALLDEAGRDDHDQ
jgi:hypothetical protein